MCPASGGLTHHLPFFVACISTHFLQSLGVAEVLEGGQAAQRGEHCSSSCCREGVGW